MRAVLWVVVVVSVVWLLAWIGLRIPPRPFPAVAPGPGEAGKVPVPEDLPVPVERYLRTIYPDGVPRIRTAVVSGRASLRIAGITFPARFRFTHDAGRGYRHDIDATIYGLPIMKVTETFVHGRARLELPFGVTENEPKVDQAATLGLWSESIWLPAIYVTDPRVRWEPVDADTALLVVPMGDGEARFVVRFDPEDGLPRLMESMRYKGADDARKTLWLNEILAWGDVGGRLVPVEAALTWWDDGRPWAVFDVEEVAYGASLDDTLVARDPRAP